MKALLHCYALRQGSYLTRSSNDCITALTAGLVTGPVDFSYGIFTL